MLAVPAFAHVTVDPNEATQGGYGTFTIRVPNESDTASTNKIEVKIPTDNPISWVGIMPKAGWTYSVEKTKLDTPIKVHDKEVSEAVSTITWTGGEIKPGEFDEFKISMGPLPEVESIELKAIQTYDNGDVSSWIDEIDESGEKPEHPAPVISLLKANEDAHTGSTSTSEVQSTDSSSDTLAYVGIGIGVVALLVALGAFMKKK